MTRRDPHSQSGLVVFPVDNPEWEMTGEGGMFVTLIVHEDTPSARVNSTDFFKCCGGGSIVLEESEVLVSIVDCRTGAQKSQEEREAFYGKTNSSRGMLAAVTLGTTGGSWGRSIEGDEAWENWGCHVNDLAAEGQALVALMQKLYPHSTVELLTHLDT